MNSDLIMAMAKAAYEALAGGDPPIPWERSGEYVQSAWYDAVWQALHLLKEPTGEMVQAGAHVAHRPRPLEAAEDRFVAMINQLLEVK